jgi:hypothetical protein
MFQSNGLAMFGQQLLLRLCRRSSANEGAIALSDEKTHGCTMYSTLMLLKSDILQQSAILAEMLNITNYSNDFISLFPFSDQYKKN